MGVADGVAAAEPALSITTTIERSRRVVAIRGELDMATAEVVRRACSDGGHDAVADLSELSFMDCRGFRGLLAAGADLQRSGHVLTMRGACGQPARLISMFEALPAHDATTA